ncbi:hypothetical protein [Serratia sp. NPDC087055]|uniref:hypothetical protein n=1 Tax=Serratia sp. NPDC087055 TaxID=3364516 RepID=UPI00384D5310
MTNENKERKDVLLKAWELTQSIAKNNSESAWKVRMWGIAIWSALVSYAYQKNEPVIVLIAIFVLAPTLIIELLIRVIEYKMIRRSHEIENSINCILLEDDFVPPENGIRIDISETKLSDLVKLISINRLLIWSPYLVLFSFGLLILVSMLF